MKNLTEKELNEMLGLINDDYIQHCKKNTISITKDQTLEEQEEALNMFFKLENSNKK